MKEIELKTYKNILRRVQVQKMLKRGDFSGYKLVKDFIPRDHKFVYNLKGACFKMAYGKCSLGVNFIDKLIFHTILRNRKFNKRQRSDYCINLFTGFDVMPTPNGMITYTHHKCDHYRIVEGQHRTCIASRKNMKIDVLIIDDDTLCEYCLCKHCIDYFKTKYKFCSHI